MELRAAAVAQPQRHGQPQPHALAQPVADAQRERHALALAQAQVVI